MLAFAFLVGVVCFATGIVGVALLAPVLWDLLRFRRGIYRIDLGYVSAYAERYSFDQGEPITLYIHSVGPLTLTTLRLAETWEPVGEVLNLKTQHQDNSFDRRKGMRWTKSIAIDSSHLLPGFYQFLLQQGSDRESRFGIPIIIKDRRPNRLSVVLATNTWDAYNYFGGISHYENHYVHRISRILSKFLKRPDWLSNCVSSRRPNSLFSDEVAGADFDGVYSSFLVRNELQFLVFLAKSGYEYSVYDDRDLAYDPVVQQASALVFCGHSEYWTDEMFYSFERFVAQGGKIFRTIAGMEGNASFSPLGLTFGPRPEDSIANALVGAHTNPEGSFTAAPFRVLCSDHWVFAGTRLGLGDLFGEKSANHPSFDIAGHQHLLGTIDLEGQPQNGASGFFTSKIGPGSGAFSILAVGMNPRGPARMVYRDTPSGGWIFNASSISFNGALLCDEVVARIVRNLMDDALGRPCKGKVGEMGPSDSADKAWSASPG
jgi:N,N-dimethylformamidase